MHRTARAGLVIVIAAAMALLPTAARADSAYQYWTYWTADDGVWAFAQLGPAARLPKDGAVEGWRFAVSTAAASPELAPRADAATTFDAACAGTAAPAGSKRIALVLDYGTANDAPAGETPPPQAMACAVVAETASSAEALGSIVDIRADAGMVCGLDGYPKAGCAELVDPQATSSVEPPPSTVPSAPESALGIPGSWLGTVVAIALLALVGFTLLRRRR